MSAPERPEKRSFFDTNVVLYLLSAQARRADRSEALLRAGGIVSVQVLNEVTSVARKKMKLSWIEIEELLALVKSCCDVVPLTLQGHELALKIAQRHQLAVYDAMICASAAAAGASVLWTEDMNDGQLVEGVRISNPFA
jgi:predicted nucleic acid-binding protein